MSKFPFPSGELTPAAPPVSLVQVAAVVLPNDEHVLEQSFIGNIDFVGGDKARCYECLIPTAKPTVERRDAILAMLGVSRPRNSGQIKKIGNAPQVSEQFCVRYGLAGNS